MGSGFRDLLQGRGDDFLDLVQQDRRRPARARLVGQPVQALPGEPSPPPGHHVLADPQLSRDGLVVLAVGAGQHDLRPQRQRLGCLRPPRPPGQLLLLGVRQHQAGLRPPRTGAVREPGYPVPSEPRPPLPHRLDRKTQISGDPGITGRRPRARQDYPRTLCHARRPGPHQPVKLRAILARQRQGRNSKRHINSLQTYVANFRRDTLGL